MDTVGTKEAVLRQIMDHQGSYYTYLLCAPDEEPFYVGKGKALRIFGHERQAQNGEDTPKARRIKEIKTNGESVFYKIDSFHDSEELAFEREEYLIDQIGRHDLNQGPLLNLTDGGPGALNLAEESIEKHSNTLAGTSDDGSDRSAVNRFFLNLGSEHRSVAIKPLAEFKNRIKPLAAHASSRSVTSRQAVALAASAVANGVILVPGCQIPRTLTVEGVLSIIENGVGKDILKSGLAELAPDSQPKDELFVINTQGLSHIKSVIGITELREAGVLPDFD
ncbi:MAG: GIY-YIG nuclease family protein [Deltaproteobacteria bacterium]|nr:GIY-YIG nuclease family protein [Deltaproteobacteria bacterium]